MFYLLYIDISIHACVSVTIHLLNEYARVTMFKLSPVQVALARPILYSNWLSKDYLPVEQEGLREYVQARLKVFYEEELDVPLVLFNEVLDHVLDRIFKQSQVSS